MKCPRRIVTNRVEMLPETRSVFLQTPGDGAPVYAEGTRHLVLADNASYQ
jgi:hypothetical protein